MRCGIIENGVVAEIAEASAEFAAEQGWIELPATAGKGWTYANGQFAAPVEVPMVPRSVTPLQMRRAIRALGLKGTVDDFIATLSEEIVEAWEYASSIQYDDPLIAMACGELGWNKDQKDALFILAAKF